jgi:Tfp pilus assembly protein PilO
MALSLNTDYFRYRHYFTNLSAFYQKKEYRAYVGLILSLFTIAFFGFFAIRPTLVTIASLTKEIEDKQMVVQKLEAKIEALGRARSEYEAISAELFLVEEALPQKTDLSLFVRQIETLAVQSGVSLQAVQFGETPILGELPSKPNSKKTQQKDKELSTITFNLSVTGDYQNLKGFLQGLEELRRLVVPSTFAFKEEKSAEGEQLLLTVTGEAYYLVQSQKK